MIIGDLKNKVDKIWLSFSSGGISNPLEVIEQITYLFFIKSLDDNEISNENDNILFGIEMKKIFPEDKQHLRWSKFKNEEPSRMFEIMSEEVFPFIKTLHGNVDSAYSKYMEDAIFKIPTPLMLAKIVDLIDKLEMDVDDDNKGDLYEYLLSRVSAAGANGQFRTPRHIIDMIVRLMKPNPQDTIIDPAAGTAGFLVAAQQFLEANYDDLFLDEKQKEHINNNMFYGFDMDRTMLRIGAMNMMLHKVDNPNIEYRDSLSEANKDNERYTLVLANPPFKGSLDYEAVSEDLLKITKTKKTELLFLALFLRILKKGGRCASIVPDGVLFGSTKGHKDIRKEIVENHKLEAIISMPSGVFKPYAGVSTSIMIFTKTGNGGTDKVWFYDMQADGLSLDGKRNIVEENDIDDIIERFNNLEGEVDRKKTEKSFFVDIEEIRANGYDLSINKYKEDVYEEISYEEPEFILGRINELEDEILVGLKEVKRITLEV